MLIRWKESNMPLTELTFDVNRPFDKFQFKGPNVYFQFIKKKAMLKKNIYIKKLLSSYSIFLLGFYFNNMDLMNDYYVYFIAL